jgi:hypothetical protein
VSSAKDSIRYYFENAKGDLSYKFSERAFRLSLGKQKDSLFPKIITMFGIQAYRKKI